MSGAREPRSSRLGLISVAVLLFAMGAGLRIWWWSTRGDLWADEAALATSLRHAEWSRLGRPFEGYQVAPIAFAALTKLAAQLFGPTERVLRFAPLLAGIACLVAIPNLCRRLFGARAALVCLALLAPATELIYFSAELKPYASDALVSTVLMGLAVATWDGRCSRWTLAAVGAVAPWCSIPAPFVLAAIGSALAWRDLRGGGNPRTLGALAAIGLLWVTSFAVHYTLFLSQFASFEGHVTYFRAVGGLPPAAAGLLNDLRFYVRTFLSAFETPFGLGFRWVAAAAFGLGLLASVRRRRVDFVWLSVGPWIAMVLASAAGKYPVQPRLIMFLVPCVVPPVAVGLASLLEGGARAGRVAAIALVCLLVAPSVVTQGELLRRSHTEPSTSELVEHLRGHARPGDVVAVADKAWEVYEFYAGDLGKVAAAPFSTRTEDLPGLAEHDGRPRVWVLIPSLGRYGPRSPKAAPIIAEIQRRTTARLDEMGRRLETVPGGASTLYLYDLR